MGEVVLEAGGIANATDRVRFSACPLNKRKTMKKMKNWCESEYEDEEDIINIFIDR